MSASIASRERFSDRASAVESMRDAIASRSTRARVERTACEIEHTSTLRAKNSCDLIRLRVQSDLKFGCSMRWSNKRRSITELNPDSHSPKSTVNTKGRQHTRTLQSCGRAPSPKSQALFGFGKQSSEPRLPLNAGHEPAFPYARVMPRSVRRAEFISVSGSRAARSALLSDLRLKRTSGVVAATTHLHAPMNSPDERALAQPGFHQPVCINC